MIRLEITAVSHVGCVRHSNEDMILVDDQFIRDAHISKNVELEKKDRYVIAIADGMGGHNSGDVASEDVLKNLQFFYHDIPAGLGAGDFNEIIVSWLGSINAFIASKGRADERFKGMGTTLVGLAYYNNDFYSLNCGDSRLYRFRDRQLTQLTTDHSLNNMLGSEKHTSIITNCIGGGCGTSYIDIVQITSDVLVGDTFMLCSDGLTDMLPDSAISQILEDGGDVDELCLSAIQKGGLDNISCCLIRIK